MEEPTLAYFVANCEYRSVYFRHNFWYYEMLNTFFLVGEDEILLYSIIKNYEQDVSCLSRRQIYNNQYKRAI